MGTNMLPGILGSSSLASRTISEPTPSSLPLRSNRPAPLQFSIGGLVYSAWSSAYSQLPENARLLTMYAKVTLSSPEDAIITGSRSAARPESPSATGFASNGAIVRTRPKPVAWS